MWAGAYDFWLRPQMAHVSGDTRGNIFRTIGNRHAQHYLRKIRTSSKPLVMFSAAATTPLTETWPYKRLAAGTATVADFMKPCLSESESCCLFQQWAASGRSVDEACCAAATTPLLRAVARGKLDLVHALLDLGAVASARVRAMAMTRLSAAQKEGRVNDEHLAIAVLFAVSL